MTGASGQPPVLCLVTDRRRAYAGSSFAGAVGALVDQARWAIDAGIDWIQIRERDLDGGPLAELAASILDVTQGSRTRVSINERTDVAIGVGADGVHLRAQSAPCAAVRALVPPSFTISRSVHSPEAARSSGAGADYLIAGTTFASVSKPGRAALLGVDGLHAIAKSARQPVLAIGGVTIDRIGDIARTGAAGIAAIGLFLGADGPERLEALVVSVRSRFEAATALPRRP